MGGVIKGFYFLVGFSRLAAQSEEFFWRDGSGVFLKIKEMGVMGVRLAVKMERLGDGEIIKNLKCIQTQGV